MARRPRATLGRVIDDLGSTLFEVVAGRIDRAARVEGVVIYDPTDQREPLTDALVLVIGMGDPTATAKMIRDAGGQGAAAVIVRLPAIVDADLERIVDESGIAVLGLTRGASWAHVTVMLRSLLAVDDLGEGDGELLAGAPAGDLFALANAVSALVDAPVTIEDLNSQVLAFSADQDRGDESRKEGILGRHVPERYTRELEERGVFQAIYTTDSPVYVPAIYGGDLSRVAIGVRAGDEILGSMWAAVSRPLTPEREQGFAESAKVVALQLLRHRAGVDVRRRLHAELLAVLLEGGSRGRDAATRLGLEGGPCCVMALGMCDPSDPPSDEAKMHRAANALSLHLGAIQPRSAVALVGGDVYAVARLGSGVEDAELRARRIAVDFLERLGERGRFVIGVGRLATDAADIPRASREAERAVRVLRSGQVAGPVASWADVGIQSLLLDLGDLAEDQRWQTTAPIARLIAHDDKRGSYLIDTLRAWLDALGDVNKAAQAQSVHPNTFRYRLQRVSEVGPFDLNDPETRFSAIVELRLLQIQQRGNRRSDP